jgi:hypothetical protein
MANCIKAEHGNYVLMVDLSELVAISRAGTEGEPTFTIYTTAGRIDHVPHLVGQSVLDHWNESQARKRKRRKERREQRRKQGGR